MEPRRVLILWVQLASAAGTCSVSGATRWPGATGSAWSPGSAVVPLAGTESSPDFCTVIKAPFCRASYFRLFQVALVKIIEYCIMELLYRALHIALHIELSYSHNSVINLEVHLPDQVSLLNSSKSSNISKMSSVRPQYSKAASLYINFRCIERCRIQNCHTRLHLTGLFLELFLMSFTRILWKFWNRKTS